MNSTSSHYKETTSQKVVFIKKDKDNMLTFQANIFLQFFWFLELGDFRQTTTKKPKTPKKCFETEFLVSRTFFWGSLEFFVFFWFPRKGVCFLVLDAEKPKNIESFLVSGIGFGSWQAPGTKKTSSFFGFSAFKTKKTNTLSTKPKETKKTRGKPKKQNFSLKPRIMFQKIVFWFLVSWW
jgi:hypothetical protein